MKCKVLKVTKCNYLWYTQLNGKGRRYKTCFFKKGILLKELRCVPGSEKPCEHLKEKAKAKGGDS